jgi:hypothetical protein
MALYSVRWGRRFGRGRNIVFALGLIAGLAPSGAGAAGIEVTIDEAKLVKLPERVATLVIGNPLDLYDIVGIELVRALFPHRANLQRRTAELFYQRSGNSEILRDFVGDDSEREHASLNFHQSLEIAMFGQAGTFSGSVVPKGQ